MNCLINAHRNSTYAPLTLIITKEESLDFNVLFYNLFLFHLINLKYLQMQFLGLFNISILPFHITKNSKLLWFQCRTIHLFLGMKELLCKLKIMFYKTKDSVEQRKAWSLDSSIIIEIQMNNRYHINCMYSISKQPMACNHIL